MAFDRALWGQLSRGILFAGVGIFLLLTTLGIIPVSFWVSLLPLWPVLLIALGLRVIFDRSPAPALKLLAPLMILGAMAFVAFASTKKEPHDWTPILVERTEGIERLRLSGDLHMAEVNLTGREAMTALLEGRAAVEDDRTAGTKLYDRRNEARIRLGSHRDGHVRVIGFWDLGRDAWEMAVPTDLPLSIDLDAAVTSGEFDLENVDVRGVSLDGAFNNLDIHLAAPTRDTRIHFEGAFHRINLHVPAGTRVYYGSDGFMNDISGRRNRPRNDEPAYRVFVDGAFNRVTVRSR